jgi:tetratricopeptide (TPR) repeat protein
MNKLFFLSYVFLNIPIYLVAQSADYNFEKANLAYADGKYPEAVELYEQIIQDGFESGEVYFNLGNSYYKLNEIGKSILYFEKATIYLPRDESLNQNLSIARLKVVDKIDSIPKLFLEIWWNRATQIFSINMFCWLTLILFILTLSIISIYIIFAINIFKRLIWVFSILFFLILILTVGKIYQFETLEFGVILDNKISVVSEPSISGTEVFILHEGTKVQINRSLAGWFEISLADGKTGWLKATSLGMI